MQNHPLRRILLVSIATLLPLGARAQTITVFNNRAAFEASMGSFKVVDDFSLPVTFLDVVSTNGAPNGTKWADIAQNPAPSTVWATPFGSKAWGGTWDNTVGGVGGGLQFELDFGGGNIVTVPGGVAGNAPANTFFGFTSDTPFLNVRTRLPAEAALGETHTLDDLTVQVTQDFADVRFVQGGTGSWDTAAHWDLAAVPTLNQRVFVTPTGGSVASGPAAAATVRQIIIGDGTAASRLNLNAAGTLTASRSALVRANGVLGGAGRLNGALTMATGSTLTVADGQTLQVGNATASGFSASGTITVGAGTLILEDTGATPLGTLTTLAGGTLTALGGTAQAGTGDTIRGHGSLTGAFELLTSGLLRAETGNLQVAQLTSLDGSATVDATRTLSIGGTNPLGFATVNVGAGGTLTAGGAVQLAFTATLGAGATVRGGLGLQLSGTVTHTGAQTFDAGTGDLAINNITFAPDATDSLLGSRITLTGTSATLVFTNVAQLGAAGNQILLNGGRLFPQGNITLPLTRSVEISALNGSVIALAGTSFTIEGNLTGAGRLALTGSSGGQFGGTVRLSGTNSHAGGTDIAGATLEVASDSALGGPNGVLLIGRENGLNDIPGRLRALGNLVIPATRSTTFRLATVDTNGFDVTFNQPVTGQDLTKQGAGVLRFNTTNTFNSGTNDISIEEGTVRLGINEALGSPRVTLSGSTLDLNGFTQTLPRLSGPGEVRLGSGGALTFIGGSTVEAAITGSGTVAFGKVGFSADLYRVLAENTFTGSVAITAGNRVSVKSGAAFGAAGNAVLLDGGGIEADFEAPSPVVIGAAFPLAIGPGGASFGANGKPLVIETLLSGTAPITVGGGGDGFEVRFAHPANTFTSSLKIGDRSSDVVLGIVANGSLGDAANIVTLGDRFFDGETTQSSSGTLRAFANLTIPATRALRLEGDGGGFDTNGFNAAIDAGISELRAGLKFLKSGEGTLVLNGTNTYTGITEVDGGTLAVNGSLSGQVNVFSESTLAGSGTVGTVRIDFGCALAPGQATGALQVADVTLADGSTLALDFASPASADQLKANGTVSLEGDVQLSLALAYSVTGPDSFIVLLNDGADPVSGFFSFGPQSLAEGATFIASGALWTISYIGGTGNDVTLTAVPEPSTAFALLGSLCASFGARRRRGPDQPIVA